jgi:hypothetical protein
VEGTATGRIAGICRHMQISELYSMEECDQVLMDFLVALQVGKFPPRCRSVVKHVLRLTEGRGAAEVGVHLRILSFPFCSGLGWSIV